jgi:hypothetical protein
MGLFHRIMAGDVLCGIKVLRALAAQINGFAAFGHNRLTQIIVEVLFGVCIRCVEFADAGMGHGRVVLALGLR